MLELTRANPVRLGLALEASRTALECGEFGSTIQALMAEVISTGTRFATMSLNSSAGSADILGWMGDAIRHARASDEFILSVAIPANLQNGKTTGMVSPPTLVQGYRAEYIQAQVERALQQTRLECMPVVQLEMSDVTAIEQQDRVDRYWPELVERLGSLRREGKVMQWGLALPAPPSAAAEATHEADMDRHLDDEPAPPTDDFPALLKAQHFRVVSLPYHLFGQSARRWFAQCASADLAVIATQPLAQGLLAGEIGSATTFHKRDPRGKRWTTEDIARAATAIAEVSRLVQQTPLAATSTDAGRQIVDRGRYPAHLIQADNILGLALRFVLASEISMMALGAKSKTQWLAAWMASLGASAPLTDDLVYHLQH